MSWKVRVARFSLHLEVSRVGGGVPLGGGGHYAEAGRHLTLHRTTARGFCPKRQVRSDCCCWLDERGYFESARLYGWTMVVDWFMRSLHWRNLVPSKLAGICRCTTVSSSTPPRRWPGRGGSSSAARTRPSGSSCAAAPKPTAPWPPSASSASRRMLQPELPSFG